MAIVVIGTIVFLFIVMICLKGDDVSELEEVKAQPQDSFNEGAFRQALANTVEKETFYPEEYPDKPNFNMNIFYFELKGLRYQSDKAIEAARLLKTKEKLRLLWESDNPKDGFAVAVYTMDGEKIGYAPMEYRRGIIDGFPYLVDCRVRSIVRAEMPIIKVNLFYYDSFGVPTKEYL